MTDVDPKSAKPEVPYKRASIPGWIFPVMIAPFVVAYGSVAAYAWQGPLPDYVPRTAFLVVGLAVATLWAPIFAAIQAAVDLLLLAVRLRGLENGMRAWGRAFLASLLPIVSYVAYSPHRWWKMGPWSVAIAAVVPMIVSAIVVRVVLGKKP
jgi:hypothetical protein